jgi:hypothetical protein
MPKTYICEVILFGEIDERDVHYDPNWGRESEPEAGLECHVWNSVSSRLMPPHHPVKFLDPLKFGPWQKVRMVANTEQEDYVIFQPGFSFVMDENGRKIGVGSIKEVLDN